ncbi:TetR/AcrR family transcriptional regulator [Macrococcus animalis]|uniref:TetR/AcrR family transcriptional regulator n=1 Tax=Macrococcus animalis TaxID=3395467 RepID=UPI0039BEC5B4
MRIVKEHDVRKLEIIEAAETLFLTKGYDSSTVNSIIDSVGIAKGTFYHYFKSKVEVLDAVIELNVNQLIERMLEVQKEKFIDLDDKLLHVMQAMNMQQEKNLDALHQPSNILYHQKLMYKMIERISPIIAQVIEEGNNENVWQCEKPLINIQIFLAATFTLTDELYVKDATIDSADIMKELILLLEKLLNIEPNRFLSKM